MPKLKREIFLRPTRFTHRFGERDDPLMPVSAQTFAAPCVDGIKSVGQNGKGAFNGKQKGLHVYTEPFSPIDKFRGGKASLGGPTLDEADARTDPIPASTQPRRTQGPLIRRRKETE